MKPLNILIDARGTQEGFKQHKHRGIGHYAAQLIKHVRKAPAPHRFTFLIDAGKPVPPSLSTAERLAHHPSGLAGKVPDFLEAQWSLPTTLRPHQFDVIHFLSQYDGAVGTPGPFIINILDVIQKSAANLYSPLRNLRHACVHAIMHRIAARASAVITISEYSKRDIVRHHRIPPERIFVTHLAAGQEYFEDSSETKRLALYEAYHLPEEFLLYVGGIDPRKNLRTLFEALAILYRAHPGSPGLVFGGRIDDQTEYDGLMREVDRLGLRDRIHFLGFVPEERLPALFAAAKVFLFPSLLEGFGLPVVQAMASGVPLIASPTSSIPEVAGSAAFYANMTSPEELSQAIHSVLSRPEEAAKKMAEGKERARLFSWQQTAASTIQVYERVAAEGARRSDLGPERP